MRDLVVLLSSRRRISGSGLSVWMLGKMPGYWSVIREIAAITPEGGLEYMAKMI
jgi:hypothetical protein